MPQMNLNAPRLNTKNYNKENTISKQLMDEDILRELKSSNTNNVSINSMTKRTEIKPLIDEDMLKYQSCSFKKPIKPKQETCNSVNENKTILDDEMISEMNIFKERDPKQEIVKSERYKNDDIYDENLMTTQNNIKSSRDTENKFNKNKNLFDEDILGNIKKPTGQTNNIRPILDKTKLKEISEMFDEEI